MKSAFKLLIILAILAVAAIPFAASAQVTSYTSGFQLQNLSTDTDAVVNIKFYTQDGTTAATVTGDTIAKNTSKTYFPLQAVAANFNGSVVVESSTQIAAIANVLGNNGQYGASYVGFTGGASKLNLPLIMKNNFGISTWFNVQNTGSTDATVTVAYKPGACTETKTIKPGAADTFDQLTNTCLPAGFVGAATVDAGTGTVVASVMQVTAGTTPGVLPNLLAYNGFTTASTNPVMPLVTSGYYNSGTGIQVQNTGATDTDVTISYSPSLAGAACTETKSIPAGTSVTFGFPNLPSTCYTNAGSAGAAAFVGSAKVSANTASMPLVAIVNQVTKGTSTAAAYGAFDPATATSKVSLPLIMDRNFNIFTGFSVANMGTQPTDISCTFTNSTVVVSASAVAPGAALTHVELNQMANGYVGSAVCTATGGDAKIAAVVNELTAGAPATTDALLVYEGINY